MSNQRKDKSSLAPYRELIEQLVAKNPDITTRQIQESLPIKVNASVIFVYRHKLGLPPNRRKDKSSLVPYRELIEQLVANDPEISNQKIAESLPIRVSKNAVRAYRHRLGLPCNRSGDNLKKISRPIPRKKPSVLYPYREIIEQLVRENPTISNEKIAQQLPIQVGTPTVASYRKMLGLPSNVAPPQGVVPHYRKQIEQWVRENPNISNSAIAKRLPFETSHSAVGNYRKKWKLPNGNRKDIKGQAVLKPYYEKIIGLVKANPDITNLEIAAQLPIDMSEASIRYCRAKLGLPKSKRRNYILDTYRKQIEALVKHNPAITNLDILKQLPIQCSEVTVSLYRRRLGLPSNPSTHVIQQRIESCRELIEELVKENPTISNKKLGKLLPIKVCETALREYRHKLGLPINSPAVPFSPKKAAIRPGEIIPQYRVQIERFVKINPTISNQQILDLLSLPDIMPTAVGKYRKLWGLPHNIPISRETLKYRALIEQLVKNNPTISNREISEYLPIDTTPASVAYARRKWKLPCNPCTRHCVDILVEYHDQIKQLVEDDPDMSNNDIRKRLPIKVSVTTIAKYRKKNGWSRPKTMQSQIVQRITAMSNPNATDESIATTEPPMLETQPQIPLDTLVRNFWADKTRAVDVLLLPPDLRMKITESVEQALAYAWKTLRKR